MAGSKPRVFIVCSREHLELGRAIQSNLEHECQARVWDQSTFGLSGYPLISLQSELEHTDFGVHVLAPDDLIETRGQRYLVPRDNVIFELGMMVGRLGHGRAFIVIPRGVNDLKLPSDLLGLTPATYDPTRAKTDRRGALGHACNEIREAIGKLAVGAGSPGLQRVVPFNTLVGMFDELLPRAENLATYFIHSRRWRENHDDALRQSMSNPKSRMTVYLPDLTKQRLVDELCEHFEDGKHVAAFVADAYDYYAAMDVRCPGQIAVRLFSRYPTYSWYRCDDQLIVAMYPNSTMKFPVPTLVCTLDGSIGAFWAKDVAQLESESKEVTGLELASIAKWFLEKGPDVDGA